MATRCSFPWGAVARARGRSDRGYVLLAVLWIAVGIGGLTVLISEAARTAIASSRNRVALTMAGWHARGCLARARAWLTDQLEQEAAKRTGMMLKTWDRVDRVLNVGPSEPDCTLVARPVGARVDVNASDAATLARLFRNVGIKPARADSMANAVVAHKPYVDLRELHLVPGLESAAALDSVLDVEPGPIVLDQASAPVLALLPGFTDKTVQRVLEARARDAPISSFHELSQLLAPDSAAASARLPAVAVFQPVAWMVTARAAAGRPAVSSVLEVRLGRAGFGVNVGRQRSWIE